jgi:hypothetical protein
MGGIEFATWEYVNRVEILRFIKACPADRRRRKKWSRWPKKGLIRLAAVRFITNAAGVLLGFDEFLARTKDATPYKDVIIKAYCAYCVACEVPDLQVTTLRSKTTA